MMRRLQRVGGDGVPAAALLAIALAGTGPAVAERLKLTDGTELTAQILDRSPESLIVQLPRTGIATVDGQPLPPPVIEGSAAPAFSATDLNGVARSLAEGRGQVLLLQFWASWCPHCRHDIELMKRLFAQHDGKGLRLVTVSIDQDVEKLKAFVRDESLPYPVISVSESPDLPDRYEARGVPSYFLIDQQGRIAGVWRGSVTEVAGSAKDTQLEQRLAALLKPSGA